MLVWPFTRASRRKSLHELDSARDVGARRRVSAADRRPAARALLALAGLLLTTAVASLPAAPAARADAAGRGGDFVSVPVTHLLDTRSGTGATGVRGPASTTTFNALGVGGVPGEGVSALLVDITAISPTAFTYLVVWPDGSAKPVTGNLYPTPGNVLSTTAVIPVGDSGKLNVYNESGNTHVLIDVHGYFSSTASDAPGRGGFVPVSPTRLVDTRSGLGAPKARIPAGGTVTVTIGNGLPVPAGAAAAFLNVTVLNAAAQTWLSLYPVGDAPRGSGMSYTAGVTSAGMAVKLGTDGKISLTSPGSVDVVIDVEGYFSAQPDQGAGLRTVPQTRLLDTTVTNSPIPPSGTVDLAIGGTNGLPTRAIAGAVLDLIAVRPTGSGYVGAWPKGGAEPPISLTSFTAGTSRAGLAVVKVGAQGKVTLKNNSGSPLHILVDLQGWFADPLPIVPPVPYAPTSALQAAPVGTALAPVDYAYLDNIGGVLVGHQSSPDDFSSVQWTAMAGGLAFSGRPTLGQATDGRVQVAAQGIDSNVFTASQTTAGQPVWGGWAGIGGSMASAPVAARLATGTTVLFAVDADGQLWHYRQTGTSPSWQSLGDADLVGAPTLVAVPEGLRVVALDANQGMKTALYTTAGSLSGWTALGGTGLTGSPAAVAYPGPRVRVFARTADGTVVTKIQGFTGTWPADWSAVGSMPIVGSPAAILDPALGLAVVVARGADNEIYRIFEAAQGSGTWGQWARINAEVSDPSATDPTVSPFTSASGQSWLIVFRNVNNATRVYDRRLVPSTGLAARATRTPAFTGRTLPAPPPAR
jgi:hypothetical protein